MKDPDIDLLNVRCRQLLHTKTILMMMMLILDVGFNLMKTAVMVTIMLILDMIVNLMKTMIGMFVS